MSNRKVLAIVVFMEYDRDNHIFYEIGKTPTIDYCDALTVYAETPNPASQILAGACELQVKEKYNQLLIDCKDPIWVEQLLNCI